MYAPIFPQPVWQPWHQDGLQDWFSKGDHRDIRVLRKFIFQVWQPGRQKSLKDIDLFYLGWGLDKEVFKEISGINMLFQVDAKFLAHT